MSTYREESNYFYQSMGILAALVATAMLFVLLPLLTQLPRKQTEVKEGTQIIIQQRKAVKAVETKKRVEEEKPREIQKSQAQKTQTNAPKFEMVSGGAAGAGIGGTVSIGMVSDGSLQGTGADLFKVPSSLYATAFELSEVDTPPQVLRSVSPQYPFLAKRNNIEGSVTLRFIVDSEGNVVEPEVSKSEPEGVFDEAALEAISKYKFKPAVKNGKNVDCIVNAPMKFELR